MLLTIVQTKKKPFAVEFRASASFCTAVVFCSVSIDLLIYLLTIPGAYTICFLPHPLKLPQVSLFD
jgi:hypothetical protein